MAGKPLPSFSLDTLESVEDALMHINLWRALHCKGKHAALFESLTTALDRHPDWVEGLSERGARKLLMCEGSMRGDPLLVSLRQRFPYPSDEEALGHLLRIASYEADGLSWKF